MIYTSEEMEKGPIEMMGSSGADAVDARRLDQIEARSRYYRVERVFRPLRASELETLVVNGNIATDWDTVLVADGFDPRLVHRCSFAGLVRIGALSTSYLRFHDLTLPIGLADSMIQSTDIGNDVVIRNVRYLSRYVIGDEVILFNIDEMATTDHAKFGNGILTEGEHEDVRVWLEIANENGGRRILPFDGIETGDAWLWAHFRDDEKLQKAFRIMTESAFDPSRGSYGHIGKRTVIKSCRIIKDVCVGTHGYIKGANKLKNLTIKSRKEATCQIGEGVELVNGIIESGSRVFYGVKAVRFVMRTNTCLKYGARLINSILGDNGTISCCEVLNSLVFPGHEQHHNNSFLCAATVLGQSNIAAGATIGSNHNSRSNDGELIAGRGFWPGLSVTLKHSSRFASFCLLAKGSYPAELNIPLPFTLVATEPDRLILRPAFWFIHNMYALARNSWKYRDRDAKLYEWQHYEYDYLAPDTVDEILTGINIIEFWAGRADSRGRVELPRGSCGASYLDVPDAGKVMEVGKRLLGAAAADENNSRRKGNASADNSLREIVLLDSGLERSARPVVVFDLPEAWRVYRSMAILYAVKAIITRLDENCGLDSKQTGGKRNLEVGLVQTQLIECRRERWYNVGGQLVREDDLSALLSDVRDGTLAAWKDVHQRYRDLAARYPHRRAEHALSVLLRLFGEDSLTHEIWSAAKQTAAKTQRLIRERTIASRAKDYENPFRRMTYDSEEEMKQVVGALEDNSFIRIVDEHTQAFCSRLEGE